jgi:hypothetical protein
MLARTGSFVAREYLDNNPRTKLEFWTFVKDQEGFQGLIWMNAPKISPEEKANAKAIKVRLHGGGGERNTMYGRRRCRANVRPTVWWAR